jgi:hypothetical protein
VVVAVQVVMEQINRWYWWRSAIHLLLDLLFLMLRVVVVEDTYTAVTDGGRRWSSKWMQQSHRVTTNRGGGGGGMANFHGNACGAGGSGVVIIKSLTPRPQHLLVALHTVNCWRRVKIYTVTATSNTSQTVTFS